MLKNLITAIIYELQLLFTEKQATIIFEADFDIKNAPSYTLPLILVCINGAPESYPLIGNTTRFEWGLSLKVYTYAIDLYMDNPNSFTLLETTQDIQNHFTRKIWLNDSLTALEETNSLVINFEGITEPNPLPVEFNSKGFEIKFGTILLDNTTNWSEESLAILEGITLEMKISE